MVGLAENLVGGFGPDEWLATVVRAVNEFWILVVRSFTEAKSPRRMAWHSMIPNQTSTKFIHDLDVAVKWDCSFLCRAHWDPDQLHGRRRRLVTLRSLTKPD